MSGRFVDTDLDRPRWRFTGNYRVRQWLQVGVEINPQAGEFGPLATAFLLTETDSRPALFFGTSSDRIGSPSGEQSYFATLSKHVDALNVSMYASLNYSEWDETFHTPVGLELDIGHGLSIRPMFDGDRNHLLLNYFTESYGISLMYVWFETVGLSVSAGF